MHDMVKRYLEDLEERIDPEAEETVLEQWKDFLTGKYDGRIFAPARRPIPPTRLALPEVGVNQAIRDPSFASMLLQQLMGVDNTLGGHVGYVPMMRASYGSNIIPTLFGCPLILMEDGLKTLPASRPLEGGGEKAAHRMLDRGIPDLDAGQGGVVMDCYAYFKRSLADYPKLGQYVRFYHPDTQGPLDIAELALGSEIFLMFHDTPELIQALLTLITDTHIKYLDRYFLHFPDRDGFGFHYGWMQRGRVRISLDSCVNFSPQAYRDCIMPHDARILGHFGGVVHSCGKVDHFVGELRGIPEGYHGFNFSQPHLNDLEKIYRNTIDVDIPIFALSRQTVTEMAKERRRFGSSVFCVG